MFRRVLVPLDGSSLAEAAIPHAAAVAATFGAEVLLLRVIPVRQRNGAAPMDIIDRRLCRAEARAYLDAVAADLRGEDVTVGTEVSHGQPAEQIVELLKNRKVDLLVLTSHGLGGCTEFPVSGTAHKVVSRSPISVLMVPTNEPSGRRVAQSARGYQRVLVGMDGSRRGEWALVPAAAIARHAAAELILAHVVQVPETIEEPASAELKAAAEQLVRLNSRAASIHIAQAQSRFERSELPIRTRVEVSANVPGALADIAEAEDVDLVVLTAHGASLSTQRRYGAMAIQILHDAKRPVLIAQDTVRRIESPGEPRAPARKTARNNQ
jgi:nucleotide-binding universal stress UspA family protein